VGRGGVDPIPLIFFILFPSFSLSLLCYSDPATAVLPRLCAHIPLPARLVLVLLLRAVLLQCMRVKTLCHIRSTANPSSEMAAETACIPDPQAAWVRSTMTEA
jgi:hypothetical protein